jgi:hypothetical protein
MIVLILLIYWLRISFWGLVDDQILEIVELVDLASVSNKNILCVSSGPEISSFNERLVHWMTQHPVSLDSFPSSLIFVRHIGRWSSYLTYLINSWKAFSSVFRGPEFELLRGW